MQKTIKRVIVTFLGIMLIAGLTGCTTFDNFMSAYIDRPAEDKNIKFGVYQPMSGLDAESGMQEVRGIELANSLKPEVLGKKIELIYADNHSDIEAAKTAVREMTQGDPALVLGSSGSVYSLVAASYLEEKKIPAIAATNVNPLVTRNNPYYFSVCFTDTYQGQALAVYANKELGAKKAAVLMPDENDEAIAITKVFTNKFKELTGDEEAIAVTEEYNTGSQSFKASLTKIKDSGVKAVFLPADINDGANILKEAKKMGVEAIFMGPETWNCQEFIDLTKHQINDNLVFSTFFAASAESTDETETFIKAYANKYGDDAIPTQGEVLAYDSYMLALDAIERAGTWTNGDLIKDELAKTTEFKGASGIITMGSSGDPTRTVVINKLTDNIVVNVCTVDPDGTVKKSSFDKEKVVEEIKNQKDVTKDITKK